MFTWISEAGSRLLACGVDAEQVGRFEKRSEEVRHWALVFSPREIAHNRSLARPAEGYCAGFCCKEALFKALETPYNFTDCELLFDPATVDQALNLAPGVCRTFGVVDTSVRILHTAPGELAAVIVLLGKGGG